MAVTGYYSRGWIYELVWGYNHLGPESLGDQQSYVSPSLNYPSSAIAIFPNLFSKPYLSRLKRKTLCYSRI